MSHRLAKTPLSMCPSCDPHSTIVCTGNLISRGQVTLNGVLPQHSTARHGFVRHACRYPLAGPHFPIRLIGPPTSRGRSSSPAPAPAPPHPWICCLTDLLLPLPEREQINVQQKLMPSVMPVMKARCNQSCLCKCAVLPAWLPALSQSDGCCSYLDYTLQCIPGPGKQCCSKAARSLGGGCHVQEDL
jgi:hypothetical protein